jgi:uncharacterized protein (DUF305 family)
VPTRSVPIAVAVVALVTVGVVAGRAVPANSEPDRLGRREIAAIVALVHHDQQGVVLAHQAEAQSPSAATRARAGSLARTFRRQSAALTGALDRSRVPTRQRLVDTTRLEIADSGAVGCDLMPDDAVSRLAAATPGEFDATFETLMGRHLVGGVGMARPVLGSDALGRGARGVLRTTQARLS